MTLTVGRIAQGSLSRDAFARQPRFQLAPRKASAMILSEIALYRAEATTSPIGIVAVRDRELDYIGARELRLDKVGVHTVLGE
jgi:hypothetical protein